MKSCSQVLKKTFFLFFVFGISLYLNLSASAVTLFSVGPKTVVLLSFDEQRVVVKTTGGKKIILQRIEFPEVSRLRVGSEVEVTVSFPAWSKIP